MRNGPNAQCMPENKAVIREEISKTVEIRCRDDTDKSIHEILFVLHQCIENNCYTGPPGRDGPGLSQETALRSGEPIPKCAPGLAEIIRDRESVF